MSAGEGAMRQPPSPNDLRRHPAKDAHCAHFRGLMRDYADGELTAALGAALELHVHDCRACALGLARSEHEVLRLRRALPTTTVEPQPGFAARTVQRLVQDLERDPELEPQLAAAGNGVAGPARGRRIGSRITLALSAMAATLMVIAGLLWQGYAEIDYSARFVVAKAFHTHVERNGVRTAAVPGALGEGDSLVTDSDGAALVQLEDRSDIVHPGANVHVAGDSKVAVAANQLHLADGSVEVVTSRPTEVALPDGSLLSMGIGTYSIGAIDYRRPDYVLDFGSPDLRMRAETVSGDAAKLARGGKTDTIVAGQVAIWHGGSIVSIDNGDANSIVNGLRPTPRRPDLPSDQLLPALRGRVQFDNRAAAPAREVLLEIDFLEGGHARQVEVRSGEDGLFEIPSGRHLDAPFAVIRPITSELPNLAFSMPRLYAVDRTAEVPVLSEPVTLSDAPTFDCFVVDDEGLPIEGALVVPTVVDGLLGMVWPIESLLTPTNYLGRGSLHSLPNRLEPHQQLGLLLLHGTHAARWVALPDANSPAAASFQWRLQLHDRVVAPHRVGVRSEANVTQDVLEVIAVEGLPSAYVVSRQTLTFRADSSPSALVGDGQLWLRQRSASQTTLRGMYYQDNVLRVSQEATQPIDERLAQLQPLIQSSGFEVVRHHRNEILATEGPHSNVQVIEGPSGVPLSQARCYAIDPDGGAARVLGTSGSAGELSGPLNGWSLLAIAADGRIAFNSPLSPATASVLQVGSLSVGQEHRPSQSQSLLLRMTAVGNNTPHGRLHATFWQYTVPNDWLMSNLPVGQYEAQLPSGEVIRGVQILADDTVVLN